MHRSLLRPCALAALVAAAFALPRPALAQEDGGSAGAAVVGGLAGGMAGLLGAYPLTGCPLAHLGAARDLDFCDVASVGLALGGVAAGAWVGAENDGAGYGMGLGLLAGFGTGFLLGKVVDTPRWLDALFILGGTVAGGILAGDEDPAEGAPAAAVRVEFLRLPF